jgi:hypothetical protein
MNISILLHYPYSGDGGDNTVMKNVSGNIGRISFRFKIFTVNDGSC